MFRLSLYRGRRNRIDTIPSMSEDHGSWWSGYLLALLKIYLTLHEVVDLDDDTRSRRPYWRSRCSCVTGTGLKASRDLLAWGLPLGASLMMRNPLTRTRRAKSLDEGHRLRSPYWQSRYLVGLGLGHEGSLGPPGADPWDATVEALMPFLCPRRCSSVLPSTDVGL